MIKRVKYLSLLLILLPLMVLSQPEGELFYSSGTPMGNVAVSRDRQDPGRVFFTYHPEAKPEHGKVFEIRGDSAYPFPDSAFQEQFISPLGLFLDRQGRLWVLDHANYALKTPSLYAFDIRSGKLLLHYSFGREVVRKWVMLNDLTVTPDGHFVIISAPGMFRKRSSIIVFDVVAGEAKRVLTDHPSVMRKKLLPVVDERKMRFILGLYKVRPGVDGIDVGPEGRYLYFTPMADTLVYRIGVDAVTDFGLTDKDLSDQVQTVGSRPMCDGIRTDRSGLLYVTDFQHHRILAMDTDGSTSIVLENDKIRWTDGLSVGGEGYLYITDSALQHVILKKKKKYSRYGPFGIWRIRIFHP